MGDQLDIKEEDDDKMSKQPKVHGHIFRDVGVDELSNKIGTKLARAMAILWKINIMKMITKDINVWNPNPTPITYRKQHNSNILYPNFYIIFYINKMHTNVSFYFTYTQNIAIVILYSSVAKLTITLYNNNFVNLLSIINNVAAK